MDLRPYLYREQMQPEEKARLLGVHVDGDAIIE